MRSCRTCAAATTRSPPTSTCLIVSASRSTRARTHPLTGPASNAESCLAADFNNATEPLGELRHSFVSLLADSSRHKVAGSAGRARKTLVGVAGFEPATSPSRIGGERGGPGQSRWIVRVLGRPRLSVAGLVAVLRCCTSCGSCAAFDSAAASPAPRERQVGSRFCDCPQATGGRCLALQPARRSWPPCEPRPGQAESQLAVDMQSARGEHSGVRN
jgi:hypothetical protein